MNTKCELMTALASDNAIQIINSLHPKEELCAR